MTLSLQQAVQLLQAGRVAEAEAGLSARLVQQPGDVEALQLRGMARGRLGQFEAGAADLKQAAKRHSQPHAVLNNLGNLYRRAGDLEGAVAAYRAALSKQAGFIDAQYNLGICLSDQGEYDSAVAAFRAVLDRQPAHGNALNGLGLALRRSGDFSAAMTAFDAALARDGRNAIALVNRGALHRALDQHDAALADLELACRLAPGMADAWFQMGHAYRTLGRLGEARQAYMRAVQCAPLRADIHRELAGLVWEMGEGHLATQVIESVLQQMPDAELHYAHAQLLLRSGWNERAIHAASAALKLKPEHHAARALRGELRVREGDSEQGLEDLRAAREATGGQDFAILHQLVEACLSTGRADEAASYLEGDAPAEHLQKHVALQATAWRCVGDGRYYDYYDYDRLTGKRFIEVPDGYASLDEFNAALSESIRRLHVASAPPIDQTLFGGTQSPGRLWDADDPVIKALGGALLKAARAFVAELPDDSRHPFLRRKSTSLELAGAWSVRLSSGGGHVDHIHPAGWISASYYVEVPESVLGGERGGWLRLGAPGIAGLDLPAERYIKPEAGAAIFFPSYMWHGVEAFQSPQVRVTAPFDLLPV